MATVPVDPLEGYIPIEHFQETDDDHSTVRIRDMPYGKRRESLVIYPVSLSFPQLSVNAISPAYPIMVTNDGYDLVVIKEFRIVGDFAFSGSANPTTLQPGQHMALYVTYTPKREGTVTGGVYINSGGAAGEEFIHLTGSGSPGSGTIVWMSGTGSPENVIAAKVGSVFCRTDGGVKTTMYVKEAGGAAKTGWVAK